MKMDEFVLTTRRAIEPASTLRAPSVMLIMSAGIADEVRAALLSVGETAVLHWIELSDSTAAISHLSRSEDPWIVVAFCDSASALHSSIDILHWYGQRDLSLIILMPDLTVELVSEAYRNGVSSVIPFPGQGYELPDAFHRAHAFHCAYAFHRALRQSAVQNSNYSQQGDGDGWTIPLPGRSDNPASITMLPDICGPEDRFKLISETIINWLSYLAPRREWFDALPVQHIWPILVELYNVQDGVPVSNLALTAGAPLSSTSRGIEKLHRAGIVQRSVDNSDKRRVIVTLSEKGREQLRSLTDAMYAHLTGRVV